jgi:hypothetical protein
MKLVEHFDDFLRDVVNLNDTRLNLLEDSIAALRNVIKKSTWAPKLREFGAHGSWAHKTIIKPVEGAAFDADLLVYVDPVNDWDAKKYLTTLRAVFADHATYKDKVRRFSHCVTIEYTGERKIDIAPVIVDRGGAARLEVCNFQTNEFEASEPKQYTDWLIKRNDWAGSNQLRKTTRLLKYLRDIKSTFTCPSMLLTTLLGERIQTADDKNADDFCDVPTALKTIIGRLDDWLQARVTRPTIRNPVLWTEVLSNAWDDDRYTNFREMIHKYREWIDDAFSEKDRDESIGKWRRVFGDDFAKKAVLKKAASVSTDSSLHLKESGQSWLSQLGDLVARYSVLGGSALPQGFDLLPHKERPKWRRTSPPQFRACIKATLHASRDSVALEILSSDRTQPLPKNHWIRFIARTSRGDLPMNDYEIHWRVTNTDAEASAANCMRGGFERAEKDGSRWESLSYRGVHSVEAFVVRRRDSRLVAESAPFYVVIE